tara:strand:+ start:1565 stop:2440 length:876 start_codon:yes stop_codon:yes gene_type:complete
MSEIDTNDYLDVDKPITGQNYVCISFVSPEKTLVRKDQFEFYHYHQYVLQEFSKVFNDLTEKIVDENEDEIPISSLINLKKRMTKLFKANQIQYSKWKESVEDFRFRDGEKVSKEFDKINNFQTSVRGVKVRGVYDTYREAEVRSKVLQKMDNRFDVFVGQVGYWLPWHPDVNKIQDQEYLNEDLNNLMKEYKKNEDQKDMFYQEETRARISEAKEQTRRLNEAKEAEQKEEADAQKENETQKIEVVSGESDEQPKLSEEEKNNLNSTIDNLQEMDPWMQRKQEEASGSSS